MPINTAQSWSGAQLGWMRRCATKAPANVAFTEEWDGTMSFSTGGALKVEERLPQGVLTNGNVIK